MKSKRVKKIIVYMTLCAVVNITAGIEPFTKKVQAATLERIGEDNRYLTATRLAKDVFKSANTVVLVNGKGYADAVGAVPFAKNLNAPILLTSGEKLESSVLSTIKGLSAKNVYIIGGKGVVSSKIESDLRENGLYVNRIYGKDKFDTNLKLAQEVLKKGGKKKAILVNGVAGYSDAISAASVAANMNYPLLISDTNYVNNQIKNFIKNNGLEVLVVGGNGVISDKALNSVGGKRIAAGSNRFDTNLKLVNYFKGNLNFDNMYVSCGGNDRKNMFADSLIAAAAAAKTNSPVILSGKGAGEKEVKNANRFIKGTIKRDSKLRIVGGRAVVSNDMEKEINKILSNEGQMGIGSQLPYNKKFIVIGQKAYTMNYYLGHLDKIDEDIKNSNGMVFYGYKEGDKNRLINTNNKMFLSEEDLMEECGGKITLYDNYWETSYVYNGNVYKEEKVSAQRYNCNIRNVYMGEKKIIGVSLYSSLKDDIQGAKYFQIKGSPYIKPIGDGEEIQCMLSRDSDNKFMSEIWLLNYDKKVIAKGYVDLTSQWSSSDGKYAVDFQLVNDKVNNSIGNIVNGGMAIQQGNYVYYNNTGDGNKLYKRALDGKFNRAISLHDARYINTYEDIIIYSNYKDNFSLYKVNDDGSKVEKICDHKATYVNVVGDYIYYSNHSDGGKIYKIKINKTEAGIVFDSPQLLCSDESEYINVVGNTVYYSNYSDGHKLYAININGTGRVKLTNESCSFINVDGSYIYYVTDGGILKKIGTDGSVPSDNVVMPKANNVNVMGDYIYYSNAADGGKIYRINKHNMRNEKICEGSAEFINLTGNFIDVNDNIASLGAENIFYSQKGRNSIFDIKNLVSSGNKSGQALTKPQYDLKVKKAYDVEKKVETVDLGRSLKYIEDKYLPDKVTVVMSDDTVRELVVVWDKDKVTDNSGVRTYTGEIIGYDSKVKLNLSRESRMLTSDQISIVNSADTSDVLTATGLNSGDSIKVYKNPNGVGLIGSASANTQGVATVSLGSTNLELRGGEVWVTVTASSTGGGASSGESQPIRVTYDAEGPRTPSWVSGTDRDNLNVGVDGRDFSINWSAPTSDVVKQYIYILRKTPQTEEINYNLDTPAAIIYDNRTTTWTGSYTLKKDSRGNNLMSGDYNVFLVYENAYGKKSAARKTYFRVTSDGTNEVRASGVNFKLSNLTLAVGDSLTPEVVVSPQNATNKDYVLEAYDSSIVTVDAKAIRALKEGTTTLKVTTVDGNYVGTCTVTVRLP